ncbi:MAG: hypothetical protein RJQ04_05450 [Longimicrobiales bacterium]
MRIAADGFIDVSDGRRVRTPGFHDRQIEAVPEGEALAYLLSHSFPGHRRIVRRMNESERKRIRLAMWADSVAERMALVDRVWRSISEEVLPPLEYDTPELLQVVYWETWAYPIYLDGNCTRVIPHGGMHVAELETDKVVRLDRMTA